MKGPMPPLKSTRTGVVHAQAECRDCEWENGNYKNALATASIHARATGHHVEVEQAIVVTYNRKE